MVTLLNHSYRRYSNHYCNRVLLLQVSYMSYCGEYVDRFKDYFKGETPRTRSKRISRTPLPLMFS